MQCISPSPNDDTLRSNRTTPSPTYFTYLNITPQPRQSRTSPLTMSFQKHPCQSARVLDISDCPPFDELHSISEYPLFYDPLYCLELNPELFEDADALSQWLNRSLRSHVATGPLHRTSSLHNVQVIVDAEGSTFELVSEGGLRFDAPIKPFSNTPCVSHILTVQLHAAVACSKASRSDSWTCT